MTTPQTTPQTPPQTPPRPQRLIVVVGTATDIGKTWVGAQVLSRLRSDGLTVSARKPAQSADATDPGPSDAEILASATGEDPPEVCAKHRSYKVAMAPPMAAAATGLAVPTSEQLLAELQWPQMDPHLQIGWFETVGGPRSPISIDGDGVTFAHALAPDLVVLVADAGLGTINSVLLSLAPFSDFNTTVFLNRFDPNNELHHMNLDWLRTREGLDVHADIEALCHTVRG